MPEWIVKRTQQIAWIPYYMDDVEDDMSAIHGVHDINTLDSVTFFKRAWRLTAHQGSMRAVLEAEVAKQVSGDREPTQPVEQGAAMSPTEWMQHRAIDSGGDAAVAAMDALILGE